MLRFRWVVNYMSRPLYVNFVEIFKLWFTVNFNSNVLTFLFMIIKVVAWITNIHTTMP
jgi:hypothetical protein